MNNKILKTLEFDKIKDSICEMAVNEKTAERISSLEPCKTYNGACRELERCDAALVMLLKFSAPRISKIRDIENSIKRINAGGCLSAAELLNIAEILRSADNLKKYYGDRDDCLKEDFDAIITDKGLLDEITSAIISEDEIADSASTELYGIRRKIKSESAKIKNTLNDMVRSERFKKFLQDPIVTMKNDRYVVPVKSEYRNEVPGIVHDISASGGTLFVEPQASVNANNMLGELYIKEKREIEKILFALTASAGEKKELLAIDYENIIELDFVFAKAKYASMQKAVKPLLNDRGIIDIKKGRHPLIPADKIVPQNIMLGKDFDSLIVTGPNTGGKTVVLKTVGLFSVMAQCGMLVPAADGTELSFFEKIFADIGDEQSIEQSLSTFSAHMKNIVEIINNLTPDSLVLFDELGAGTDPTEGAALAGAVLEYVRKMGAKTVATTHYSELKLYALSTKRVENASCEFNVDTLSPTYRLLIGVPGKSNAFAISKRLGLSDFIIESAKEKISAENVKFEDVLSNIEKDRQNAEKYKAEQENLKKEVEELKKELEEEREKLNLQRDKLVQRAQEKASKIIEDAKNETEKLLEIAKTAKAEKDEKETLRVMEEVKKELGVKLKKTKKPQIQPGRKKSNANINTLKPGASVLIIDLNDKGTVVSVNKKDGTALIQMGIMKTVSKISNLVVLEDETVKNLMKFVPKSGSREVQSVKTEIDLRGMVLEEAIDNVDNFLDKSVMSGLQTVTLIHGKGTGVLRSGIQNMLRRHPHVKSFRSGRYGEGENGVTVVELK